MEYFPTNLKILRVLSRLTQATIKDRLGIQPTTWSNYERGKSFPNLEQFWKISKFFGVSETDLLNSDMRKGEVLAKISKDLKGEVLGEVSGEVLTKIRKLHDIRKQLLHEVEEKDASEEQQFNPLNEELEAEISKLWNKMNEIEGRLMDKINANENGESLNSGYFHRNVKRIQMIQKTINL